MNSSHLKHASRRAGLRIGFNLRGSRASNRPRRQRPSHASSPSGACRAVRSVSFVAPVSKQRSAIYVCSAVRMIVPSGTARDERLFRQVVLTVNLKVTGNTWRSGFWLTPTNGDGVFPFCYDWIAILCHHTEIALP